MFQRPRLQWRPKAVQPPPGQGSAVGVRVKKKTVRPVNGSAGSFGGSHRYSVNNNSSSPPPTPVLAKKPSAGVGAILCSKSSLKQSVSMPRDYVPPAAGTGWDVVEDFLETIISISTEIRPEEAAERIIEESCKLLKADRTTLFFVDAEANELILVVARGADNIRLPIGVGIAGSVAESGRTVNIPDAYQDSRFNPAFDKQTGYKTTSILCTPVFDPQGGIVAVLQCINKLPDGTFSAADQLLLERVAAHTGVVLRNAKFYEAERSAKAKVAAMLEIIRMVHSSGTSTHSLIFALSNRCHDLVDGDRCTLYLVDKPRSQLVVMQGDVDIRFPVTSGIAGAVASSGKHIIIDDAYDDPRFNKSIDLKTGYRTQAMLVLPVFGEEREGKKDVVGVLQIINKVDDGAVFTDSDYEMLNTILMIAGPILDRSKIFQQRRDRDKMQVDEAKVGSLGMSPPTKTKTFTPQATNNAFAEEDEEEEEDEFC